MVAKLDKITGLKKFIQQKTRCQVQIVMRPELVVLALRLLSDYLLKLYLLECLIFGPRQNSEMCDTNLGTVRLTVFTLVFAEWVLFVVICYSAENCETWARPGGYL